MLEKYINLINQETLKNFSECYSSPMMRMIELNVNVKLKVIQKMKIMWKFVQKIRIPSKIFLVKKVNVN